jgi:cell division protein FtsB
LGVGSVPNQDLPPDRADKIIVLTVRRLLIVLYLALFAGLGVGGGLLFYDARGEYLRLVREEAANRRHLAEAEARLHEQETILQRLRNDPAYVERVIRSKLGYAQPDEFIFRFESPDLNHE